MLLLNVTHASHRMLSGAQMERSARVMDAAYLPWRFVSNLTALAVAGRRGNRQTQGGRVQHFTSYYRYVGDHQSIRNAVLPPARD